MKNLTNEFGGQMNNWRVRRALGVNENKLPKGSVPVTLIGDTQVYLMDEMMAKGLSPKARRPHEGIQGEIKMTEEQWNNLEDEISRKVTRKYYKKGSNKTIREAASTAYEDLHKWSKEFKEFIANYDMEASNKTD